MLTLNADGDRLRRFGVEKAPRILAKLFQAVAAAEVVRPAFELERSGSGFRVYGHAADWIDGSIV